MCVRQGTTTTRSLEKDNEIKNSFSTRVRGLVLSISSSYSLDDCRHAELSPLMQAASLTGTSHDSDQISRVRAANYDTSVTFLLFLSGLIASLRCPVLLSPSLSLELHPRVCVCVCAFSRSLFLFLLSPLDIVAACSRPRAFTCYCSCATAAAVAASSIKIIHTYRLGFDDDNDHHHYRQHSVGRQANGQVRCTQRSHPLISHVST